MKKIIRATLFFMISVFLVWFTVDAAVITVYGTTAGGRLEQCSVNFMPHNPNNPINRIHGSPRSMPGISSEKEKHEGNDNENKLTVNSSYVHL
jgi:hypothetical protein